MKIIYMGTPDFAVEALEALASSRHEVTAVFTQPDKPKGRGKAMQFTPVKEVALRENILVYQPKKVRDPEVIQKIRELAPDVLVVVAFGQIIPQEILDIAPYGCINVHGSLLPKYLLCCAQVQGEAGCQNAESNSCAREQESCPRKGESSGGRTACHETERSRPED